MSDLVLTLEQVPPDKLLLVCDLFGSAVSLGAVAALVWHTAGRPAAFPEEAFRCKELGAQQVYVDPLHLTTPTQQAGVPFALCERPVHI